MRLGDARAVEAIESFLIAAGTDEFGSEEQLPAQAAIAEDALARVRAIGALRAAGMVTREQCSMRTPSETNDVNAMCEDYLHDPSFRRRVNQRLRRRVAAAAKVAGPRPLAIPARPASAN